jgi:hypothetical protein
MGGFSWLHPAADAAGDPHSRSLCRAKPVYSGLNLLALLGPSRARSCLVATERAALVIGKLAAEFQC